MNTITIVIWSVFQFINIMIEDNKGTCSHQVSLTSDYLYYSGIAKVGNGWAQAQPILMN